MKARWTSSIVVALLVSMALMGCNLFEGLIGGGEPDGGDGGGDAVVEGIEVSPASVNVDEGASSAAVAVTLLYDDGTDEVITDATWTSADASIATVSSGVITGVSYGSTTVTASADGFSADVSVTVNRLVGLYADSAITTFVDGTDTAAGDELARVAAYDDSVVSITDNGGLGEFVAYPAYWNGAVAWLARPTAASGAYDLSGVTEITFEIQSDTIQPSEIGYFVQWDGANSGEGGEFAVSLADLGVTDISSWTEVTVDMTSTGDISDDTADTTRFGRTAISFFTDNGNQYVETAFALMWVGSAGVEANSGPLTAGEDYLVGNIAFVDGTGSNVTITDGIIYPAGPDAAPAAPTVADADVVSLYNSSGTLTDVTVANWNPNWGQGGSITDTDIGGATLKVLDLRDYQGIEIGGDGAGIDITGKLTLYFDYYTEDGTEFSVAAIDGGTENLLSVGAITQGSWQTGSVTLNPVADPADVYQIKFTGAPNGANGDAGTFWLDNIYFAAAP